MVSKPLRHAGWARLRQGYQQSYPQLCGITLQVLKNQPLRPMSSGEVDTWGTPARHSKGAGRDGECYEKRSLLRNAGAGWCQKSVFHSTSKTSVALLLRLSVPVHCLRLRAWPQMIWERNQVPVWRSTSCLRQASLMMRSSASVSSILARFFSSSAISWSVRSIT